MWPKKKWRRHWNIKLNSGWSSGNSFNENQYTKTYTYIQIWCNHRESDCGKKCLLVQIIKYDINFTKKHFYLLCEINFTKKIHFFREINFAKNTYLFFRLRLYMISWWCWFYMKEWVCQKFLFFEEIFSIKFNFFANKLRSNYLIFSTLIK